MLPRKKRIDMKHDVVFLADTHEYIVDGQSVPSVTEILAPLHKSYKAVNPSVLEYAANRGKAVHEALELYDLGGELEATPETEGYIRAYLEWCQVYRPKWTAVEQIVYHEMDGYAGTLDRLGYLNGTELAVVDIKTSQATKESLVSVCLQTYAYAMACQAEYDPRCADCHMSRYGLFLKADGTYRIVNCREYEDKYEFSAFAAWNKILNTHKLITKLLERGKK